ncbi:binding protein of synaptojanin polyphosphoinositide phosphatase domain [Zygosaccharomyces mellis]|uniref:Binding protein of synaptojanin polyphosphoinositide phosphatase domain n=1 Tax=Zygosaccharomyces mellis TaxID=42258 RepID=A0A4C2EA79_9SACH|nr:binding protein of synaptojanin polyphosphoinositide phosphatase domain [Zygosaccharomyces mellis]
MGRSAELEEFLKRVEHYDLQRDGNNNAIKTVNTTSNEANSGYSEESLIRARKLLSENGVAIVDKEPRGSTLDAPELAYRSAYNYERTFSPRRIATGSKTYMVSEDDYLLLQRLKAKEKPPAPLPPREKYEDEKSRDSNRLKTLLDGVTTPFFSRTATSLPSNDHYNIKLESESTKSPYIEAPRSKEPPPLPPKARSRTKNKLENADSRDNFKEPTSQSVSPPSSPTRLCSEVELKTNPRKFNLQKKIGSPERALSDNNEMPSSPAKELPPSSLPHFDFLDSVGKNEVESKLETSKSKPPLKSLSPHADHPIDSNTHKSTPPTKPSKPVQLANSPKISLRRTDSESYISSALKSSSPQSTSSNNIRTNFEVPSKPSTETFINSALKSSPPPPSTPTRTNTTLKPRPLAKPASLKKPSKATESDEVKPGKPVELAQPKPSGSNECPKPRVPAKKPELALPKLRHVDPNDSNRSKIKQETDFTASLKKATPPEVPKKNPDLPEALARLGNLSRAEVPPKREEDVPEALIKVGRLSKALPSPRRKEDVPEALVHLEKLNKVSKQPPVPPRKISMEEALQKAQELKKQQQKQPQLPEEELKQPKDMKSELGAVLKMQKLQSSKHFLSSSSSTEPSSSNNSTTTLDSSDRPNVLSHATKTRSKGPKRRVPTSIKK